MTQTASAPAPPLDPYKSYRFRVKWDGRYVAGVSRVGALRRSTEVGRHLEGGDPATARKSPGRTEYDAITLERGVTNDTEFERWADLVARPGTTPGQDIRKDIVLELYNEAGQIVLAYRLYRCWVSEYQALPDLDAHSNAVAIESIKLEIESWERDRDIAPPA
jgi:phage tail-like protein